MLCCVLLAGPRGRLPGAVAWLWQGRGEHLLWGHWLCTGRYDQGRWAAGTQLLPLLSLVQYPHSLHWLFLICLSNFKYIFQPFYRNNVLNCNCKMPSMLEVNCILVLVSYVAANIPRQVQRHHGSGNQGCVQQSRRSKQKRSAVCGRQTGTRSPHWLCLHQVPDQILSGMCDESVSVVT